MRPAPATALLLVLAAALFEYSALAQPSRVIARVQEGERVLFEGVLMEEELLQIPIQSSLLKVELTFQSYDKVEIYIGGDFIVKEISSASLSTKGHKLVLEKAPGAAIMALHLSLIAEAGKTILAIYDEEGRPIAIFRRLASTSVNESTAANVRKLVSSLQNALDSSPLPEGLKAKYKEAIYKSVILLEEGRVSEAEKLVSEALERFKAEDERFKRIAVEVAEARKALIEKVSSSSLSSERVSKAVALLNSAEEELRKGGYDQAEVLVAQAYSALNPNLFERLSEHIERALPLVAIAILIFIIVAIVVNRLRQRPPQTEAAIPQRQRRPHW